MKRSNLFACMQKKFISNVVRLLWQGLLHVLPILGAATLLCGLVTCLLLHEATSWLRAEKNWSRPTGSSSWEESPGSVSSGQQKPIIRESPLRFLFQALEIAN